MLCIDLEGPDELQVLFIEQLDMDSTLKCINFDGKKLTETVALAVARLKKSRPQIKLAGLTGGLRWFE
jgi:hypothetical protein